MFGVRVPNFRSLFAEAMKFASACLLFKLHITEKKTTTKAKTNLQVIGERLADGFSQNIDVGSDDVGAFVNA